MVDGGSGGGSFLTCSAIRVVWVELLAHLAGVSESLAGLLYHLT